MKKIFYLMLVALTMGMFTACDDDDENTPQINNPEPIRRYSKDIRSNQNLYSVSQEMPISMQMHYTTKIWTTVNLWKG